MSSVLELQSGLMSSSFGLFPATLGDSTSSAERPVVRLREPRDLYSTTSLQHPPKWPVECQVIPEKVRHIETAPAKLEPFYVTTNSEPQPKPVGEEMGTVVYDYQPKLSVDYFCRSCVGGSDILESFDLEPNALKFESRFESGNLAKAIKVTNVYYELHLRQDLYTDRHSQWFYFRIQNMKDNVLYRFSIVNFNKPDSLYRYGLKVLMYSEKEAQLNKVGWMRCGQNISYFKNDIPSEENGSLYTMTFNLKFRHNNDTVYLAHCYPYTYSTLQNYLRTLEDDTFKSELLSVRLLCRSLAGNNVYILTITSPDSSEENQKKPAVVISARVHPGETQSSFMMKGIIDFLTSNSPQAKELRDRFIFKLIPMLNPDGVIVGNSRCCLLGQDLNRQYRTVLREAFPQIYQTKVMLRRLAETNGIFLYCDIHGHSRRNNVFIYGCENRKFPEKKLIEQVFPLMMHKNSTDKFSFQNCKFRVQKNKEGTGRVFAWTLGVVNSFTLEISLGGSTMPSRHCTHFNTSDYEAVGRHFCETLLDFSDPSPIKERLREKILQKLTEGGSNADEPINVPVTDYSSLSHSESDASGDESEKKSKEETLSNPLKRQASLRISKKRVKPSTIIPKLDQRAPLSMSKASVNSIRFTQSQKFNPNSSQLEEAIGPTDDFMIQRELAVFKRLTKFRRKTRKSDVTIVERETLITSGPKCTSILFDDPFNPPGTFPKRNIPHELFVDGDTEQIEEGSGSGTEDECDEHDGAMKSRTFTSQMENNEVTEGLRRLSLSSKKIPAILGQPNVAGPIGPERKSSLGPFVPQLPQGKPLRSFYSMDLDDNTAKKGFLEDDPLQKTSKQVQKRRASLATTTTTASGTGTTSLLSGFHTSSQSHPSLSKTRTPNPVLNPGRTIIVQQPILSRQKAINSLGLGKEVERSNIPNEGESSKKRKFKFPKKKKSSQQ